MKKILQFFLLISITVNSYAQVYSNTSIALNKTDDGIQTIATNPSWVRTSFTDTHPISYQLFYSKHANGVEVYGIHLSVNTSKKNSIPKNGLLLIKTTDNTIIEAKRNSFKDEYSDTNINHGIITYNVSSVYEIELDDLIKISQDGIKKIRIETGVDYIESTYKPKRSTEIAQLFSNMLTSIQNELKTNKKDIYNDF